MAEIKLIDMIDDKDLKETVEFAESEKIVDLNIPNMTSKEKSEIKELVLEKLGNYLREKNDSLRERISELRKSGKDVDVEGLKSIHIPLKIRVFLSNYSKQDFKGIIKKLSNLDEEIKEIEEKTKKRD